jgi:hypothetical protein
MQAEVDAGGAAGGGQHAALVHVEDIVREGDVRVGAAQRVQVAPMRGGARPASSPAAATTKTPEQSDSTRAPRACAFRSARHSGSGTGQSRRASPAR